jgi:hypothetical protein
MAFDFLGVFSRQDIDSLRSYLQSQLDNVDAQINHLVMDSNKLQATLSQLIDYSSKIGSQFRTYDMTFLRTIQSQVMDSDSAILVQNIKQPYYQNIKIRENNEHKIKKIMDKIEQTQEQIHLLRISKSEFVANFEKINSLFDSKHRYLTTEEVL